MDNQFAIQLFEQQQVRIVWDAEVEKYYFSIVDVELVQQENGLIYELYLLLHTGVS